MEFSLPADTPDTHPWKTHYSVDPNTGDACCGTFNGIPARSVLGITCRRCLKDPEIAEIVRKARVAKVLEDPTIFRRTVWKGLWSCWDQENPRRTRIIRRGHLMMRRS